MPAWLPPLAAGLLAVLVLNAAWLVQRLRKREPDDWPARFVRELRHWDGRVPEELRGRPDRAARPPHG